MKKISLKTLIKTGKTSYSIVLPKEMLQDLEIDPVNDQILIYNDGEKIILSKFKGSEKNNGIKDIG
jgi:bifunctional DNA-binding transcriptional regulator/antitoxin component of YhaV-PrlF toxin-antitoxin module